MNKLKKIGILTYHDTTNFGAVLQAFALQRKIENMGYNSEIIDYKCSAITDRYKIIPIYKSKNIKQLIKSLLTNNHKRKLKVDFNNFNDKYQKISNISYDKSTIKKSEEKYDMIISGSDQVWNLELSGNDTSYMLDFIKDKKKKGTYAVSFGYKAVPSKYYEKTKKYINKFNKLLVREQQGKEIIKEMLRKNADVVLDPTLLFDKEEWINLLNIQKKTIKNDYILLYIIAPNKSIIKFTKKLAKKKNCKIIYINDSYKKIFGMRNIWHCTPKEFLEYIYNAKYIVTTSFHGVAFSINFEKEFFYALSSEKGNFNSRIENLIQILKINNRNINTNHNIDQKLDYNEISKNLTIERNKSKLLLKEELDGLNDKK